MCGIVGITSSTPIMRNGVLASMCETLHHRGPDDSGEWWSMDGCVGLAHRRLAVIDLSSGGHQPMSDVSGRVCITFNGEIYNYREVRYLLESRGQQFRSASDTEVILEAYRAWGLNCVTYLSGMFAFAIYDSDFSRIFMARDRVGEKPLFYWHQSEHLCFASELKALMAHPDFKRRLNLEAFNYYLAYGYVPDGMCMLEGVCKLLPGQGLTYDLKTDTLRTWTYWQIPEPSGRTTGSQEDLTNELEMLLEESVRRQLVADVPVGILLSGGIDSSLVTAMAARVSSDPVKTFTVTFPGHKKFDESGNASLVSKYFGTRHSELIAEPTSVDLLPELARQFDEPIADSSIVLMSLVSRLIRQHATVALAGDGADELFGGYPHYLWINQQAFIRRWMPTLFRRMVGKFAYALPVGFRGRNHALGFTNDLPYSIAHINLYFDQLTRNRLLNSDISNRIQSECIPEDYRANLCRPEYSPLRQVTEADFKTTLVNGYLVKVDRASMLSSLEVRTPWLDHNLITFAFGAVPDNLRASKTERKILLRRLGKRLLPSTLDLRRKQGFSLPMASWMKGEWGLLIRDVLEGADQRIFNGSIIRELLMGQRQGLSNTGRLFSLTFFELWRRTYKVDLPL